MTRPMRIRSVFTAGAAVAAALTLAACSKSELYTGLSERETNEMIAVLQSANVSAAKSTTDNKTWTLSASQADFPRAVALLQARGYPRDHYESLGDVFKKSGFVSSPLEEHARLIYGLSQELSNTISRIDGVVDARVLLSVPEADPMSDQQKPSSASVFIKHDPQVDLSGQIASVKALVVNAIEGLPYDKVTVVLIPARPLPPMVQLPVAADIGGFAVGVIALVAGGAAAEFWRRSRRRPALPASQEAAP